jgi:ribonuclease HI
MQLEDCERISIGTDNIAVIRAIRQYKPKSENHLVDKIQDMAEKLGETGTKVIIEWVPGHKGVRGNDATDAAAKQPTAVVNASSDTHELTTALRKPLPISASAQKEIFMNNLKEN